MRNLTHLIAAAVIVLAIGGQARASETAKHLSMRVGNEAIHNYLNYMGAGGKADRCHRVNATRIRCYTSVPDEIDGNSEWDFNSWADAWEHDHHVWCGYVTQRGWMYLSNWSWCASTGAALVFTK